MPGTPVLVMHLRDQTTLDSYGQEAVAEPAPSLAETPCYLVAHIEVPGRCIPILGPQITELGGVPAIRQRLVHDRPRVSFTWTHNVSSPPAQIFKGPNIATALAHPGTRAMIWDMFGLGHLTDPDGAPVPVVGYAPSANTVVIVPEQSFRPVRTPAMDFARQMPDPGAWVNFITRITPPTEPGWGYWVEDPATRAQRTRREEQQALYDQAAADARRASARQRYQEFKEHSRRPWWKKII